MAEFKVGDRVIYRPEHLTGTVTSVDTVGLGVGYGV
jgi:RNA polymerase-interacting CarD/CdnL/TRCF family regulator